MSKKQNLQKTKKRFKNIENAWKLVNPEKFYDFTSSIEILKKASYVKFNQTLEAVVKLNIDPKRSDQMVRGVTPLPAGTGKTIRVAVVCKEENMENAKKAGADLVGGQELVDAIKAGNINFDVCITSPDMMPLLSQVARILGPKGLMPNPKLGTVTPNLENAIKSYKAGQLEYRADKNAIIHAGIGKLSFSKEDLHKNFEALLNAIIKAKPTGVKGKYLEYVYLSSTMGPSVKLNIAHVEH